MTQAERLIRNLCESARAEIKDAPTLKTDDLELADLPLPVRSIVTRLREYHLRSKALEKRLTKAGYHVDKDDGDISVAYQHRMRLQAANVAKLARQRETIKKLETAAIVDSLDKKGSAVQRLLRTLQTALAKV